MKRKLILNGLLISMLTVITVLGVSTYQKVSAATGTQTDEVTQESTTTQNSMRHGTDSRVSEEGLAEALGITTDELSTAAQAAWETGLDQAVEQGLLTQAEADELKADGKVHLSGGRSATWLTENGIDYEALLAGELGISVEQLQAAYTAAQEALIDQAVADGYLTEEQALLKKARTALSNNQAFRDSLQSAYEDAIQQAVDDGVITQEQADLLLAQTSIFDMGGKHGSHLPGMLGDREGGRGHRGSLQLPSTVTEETEVP